MVWGQRRRLLHRALLKSAQPVERLHERLETHPQAQHRARTRSDSSYSASSRVSRVTVWACKTVVMETDCLHTDPAARGRPSRPRHVGDPS